MAIDCSTRRSSSSLCHRMLSVSYTERWPSSMRMGTGRKAERALTKRITCLNPANGFRAHRRLRPPQLALIWYTASTLGDPVSQPQARRPECNKRGGCGRRSNYSCLIGRSRRVVPANRDATLRELVGSRVATSAPCLAAGSSPWSSDGSRIRS